MALAGVLLGLLWLWLAPRVPLVSDGKAVFLKDTEGEQAIGADGTFMLLALGVRRAVSAVVVFLLRRRGGVPLVVGARASGGLLGVAAGLAARGLARARRTDVVAARARRSGKGVDVRRAAGAAREGGAAGVAAGGAGWCTSALTALFGPRDPEPAVSGAGERPDVLVRPPGAGCAAGAWWGRGARERLRGPVPAPPASRNRGSAPDPGCLKRRDGLESAPAGLRGAQARPIGASTAPVSFARSGGDSSTSRPRRPAETQIVACAAADASSTVGSRLRWPSGEMPPRT